MRLIEIFSNLIGYVAYVNHLNKLCNIFLLITSMQDLMNYKMPLQVNKLTYYIPIIITKHGTTFDTEIADGVTTTGYYC